MLNLFQHLVFQHLVFSQQLSEPLKDISVLSGADVKGNGSQIIVNGNVVAAGKVDSSISATDTVIQQTLCVTQRFLDSLNAQRQSLKAQTGIALPYADIGDTSFSSGVYEISSSLTLSKTITLTGDSASVFVFNISGDLFFSPNTQIILSGGVKAENIFFNVDGKVVMGDSAIICGNFLANGSIYCSYELTALSARLLSADTVSFESARDTVGVPAKSRIAVWGTTCECAVDLDSLVNICPNNFTMNGGEMWFSFTAQKSASRFVLVFPPDSLTGETYSLTIFSGSCDSLVEIITKDTASIAPYLRLDVWNLVIGNTYFVKASRTYIVSDSVNISLCWFVCKSRSWIEVTPCYSPPVTTNDCYPPLDFYICTGENVFITPAMQYNCNVGDPYYPYCCQSPTQTTWSITITDQTTGNPVNSFIVPCGQTLQTSFPTPGHYCVTQVPLDANGIQIQCANKGCFCFHVYESFNLSATAVPNPICIGSCATLTANVTGGSGNFGYQWSPGGQTTPSFSVCPTVTTTYSVTVTDNNIPLAACCRTKTAAITVTVTPLPVANAGPDATICFGTCTTLNGSGGVIYSWSPSTGLSNSTIANPIACPSVTTTYTLTVTDANGCTGTDQVTITIAPLPVANAGPDVTFCIGQPCPTLSGSGGGTYSWSPATGLSCTNCSNPTACPTANTTYTLTVTDIFGCTNTDAVNVSVGQIPVAPTIAGNPNDCTNPTVYTITNYNSSLSYAWTVTGGTIISGGCATCSTATINWNLPTNQSYVPPCPAACGWGVVSVTANNSLCASAPVQMPVFPCCPAATPSVIALNNISVTQAAIAYGPSVFVPSAGGYTVNTYTLAINGQFTIDDNLTLTNCDVSLATNSKIFINSGKTLSLITTSAGGKSTTLHNCCDIMWDGIYIEDNTARLITNSTGTLQTTIEYAKNAIVSNSGGDYQLTNTLLQRNNIDIVVNPYSGNHTGIVRQCTLRTAPPPMFPYIINNQCNAPLPRTYIGIKINRVADIQIGDPTTVPPNLFDNMNFGIHITASKARVFNNRLQNITNTQFFNDGMGVFIRGGKLIGAPVAEITVGGPGNQANTFDNVSQGVVAQNFVRSVTIEKNLFRNSTLWATRIINCPGSSIFISQNIIFNNQGTAGFYGIVCTDIGNSTTWIGDNTINQTVSNLSATISPMTGIAVANVLPRDMILNIQNNKIYRYRTGIHLVNAGAGAKTPLVDNNNIMFTASTNQTYLTPHYGVRLQNCMRAQVSNNTISKAGPVPILAISASLQGINVENSPQTTVAKNTINRMGSGIFAFQSCPSSIFVCNTLSQCFFGFDFQGPANISDQYPGIIGGGTIGTRNRWFNNINVRLNGSISPTIHWYYHTLTPLQYSPFPHNILFGLFNSNNPELATNPAFDVCALYIAPPPPDAQQREAMFGKIVRNQNQFMADSIEFKYAEKQFAFRYFKHNPAILQMNASDDSLYQNFHTIHQSGNIGLFEQVNDLIAQDNISGAISLNTSISPNYFMEDNRKVVNDIYLRTWANGIFELSSADSSVLYDIAIQNPLLGGNAIYSARVMLGLDPAQSSNKMQEEFVVDEKRAVKSVFSKIYPNPNDGTMQLDYLLKNNVTAELSIYDITGRKVVNTYKLANERNTLSISEGALKNGVYFYEIKVNNEMMNTGKIVVIK